MSPVQSLLARWPRCPHWSLAGTLRVQLNEWMRAPHNDGNDDEEEEVKGAEIQVSVPD